MLLVWGMYGVRYTNKKDQIVRVAIKKSHQGKFTLRKIGVDHFELKIMTERSVTTREHESRRKDPNYTLQLSCVEGEREYRYLRPSCRPGVPATARRVCPISTFCERYFTTINCCAHFFLFGAPPASILRHHRW